VTARRRRAEHVPEAEHRLVVDILHRRRVVNDRCWYLRIQPIETLDTLEEATVMDRILELLQPFYDAALVRIDLTVTGPRASLERCAARLTQSGVADVVSPHEMGLE
jgi:hypothetical protein